MKTKKTRIANYLKLGTFLFGMSLLLWNCEKEADFIVQESQIQNSLQVKQSSFEEMIQDLNFKSTFEKFEEEKEKYKRKQLNAKSSKPKNNELYDFQVIKKKINIIKKDSITSYTFGVKRQINSTDFFENLVLSVHKEGKVKAYLIRYIKDENSKLEPVEEGFSFKGTIKTVKLDFKLIKFQGKYEEECIDNFLTLCTGSGQEAGACSGSPHIPSGQCLKDYSHCIGMTYVGRTCTGSFSSGGDGISYDSTNPHNTSEGGGGSGTNNNNVNTTPVVYPCGDEIHHCTKKANFVASNLGVDRNLLDNLSESILDELDEIATLKESISTIINSPSFDPLNDSWLKTLRELSKKIEYIRTHIPELLGDLLIADLNLKTKIALNLVALQFTPNVAQLTETQKQDYFNLDGEKGIGVLLYEFANGKGPDVREFSNGSFWNEYFSGDRTNEIKANFEKVLNKKGLTFNQFIANGNMIEGSNAFSPDHAGVVESFQAHKKANWVQFFVGGTSIEYRPTNQTGYIDVKITNPTSRNSLLLHVGENYPRWKYGSIPLSSIEQHFYIRIKVR